VTEEPGRGTAASAVVAVDQVESPHPIRYVGAIGEPFPIHTTAAGQVFLAFAERPVEEVVAAELTAAERKKLAAKLDTVRAQGFALVGDATRSTAIAAPVRDVHGAVIGVISVVGPSDRVADAETRLWPVLRDATTQLSHPPLADAPAGRAAVG
jgi:DNA-binding IclR family transcriptional regulator